MLAEKITNPILPLDLTGKTGSEFFSALIPNLIELAFVIAAIIFIFIVIIGAIQWIFSGGDKTALQSAQGKISNAIIGLVVLLSIFAVITLLGYFFNIKSLQSPFNIEIPSLVTGGS